MIVLLEVKFVVLQYTRPISVLNRAGCAIIIDSELSDDRFLF